MVIKLACALLCLYTAEGNIVLSARPSSLTPGGVTALTCSLGCHPDGVDDVFSIAIAKGEITIAGVSDTVAPEVSYLIRARASASGRINHTHVVESFLVLSINYTDCRDAGEYRCKMNVRRGGIIMAASTSLQYALPANLLPADVKRLCNPSTKPKNSGSTSDISALKYQLLTLLVATYIKDGS